MKNKSQAQYEQSVFLEGVKLKGVTSVDGSYTHSVKPINVLGQGTVKTVIADVPQADFSISRNLAFADIFNPFTGVVSKLRGSLNYGDKVLVLKMVICRLILTMFRMETFQKQMLG